MLQRACLRQGMSFCRAMSCLNYIHIKADMVRERSSSQPSKDLERIKLVVKLNQAGIQSKTDLQKFLDPTATVFVRRHQEESIANIILKSDDETLRCCNNLRGIGFEVDIEKYVPRVETREHRQLVLDFQPGVDPETFIRKEIYGLEDLKIDQRKAYLTFTQGRAARRVYHMLLRLDSITASFMGNVAEEMEIQTRRRVWVVCDSRREEDDFSALLKGTANVFRFERYGKRFAKLSFESEEEADRFYIQILKQRLQDIEVYFVGKKRQEVHQSTRMVLLMYDKPMIREEIYRLSDDVLHVKMSQNKDGPFKNQAFLDFESEDKLEENMQRFLDKKMDVSRIGRKWLLPEDECRAMYIEFTQFGVTQDDVAALSPEIIKFRLKRKATGQSYATLVFDSEEVMLRNFMRLEESGYTVGFQGKKRFQLIYESMDRSLIIKGLPNDMTKTDVWALSDDIIKVTFRFVPYDKSHAFVEFANKETLEKNLAILLEKGFNAELTMDPKMIFEQRGLKHQTLQGLEQNQE